MKKILTSILFATTAIYADTLPYALPDLQQTLHSPIPYQEANLPKQGYFYLRFTTADSVIYPNSLAPGFGLGYRRLANDGAFDMSINGNGSNFDKYCWTFPRVSYLHYLAPNAKKSAYAGAGLAWGGVAVKKKRDFTGIMLGATLGYEFSHKSPLLGFAELNVIQPAIPLKFRGGLPGPVAELSVGGGF